jgi:hypothetical protein
MCNEPRGAALVTMDAIGHAASKKVLKSEKNTGPHLARGLASQKRAHAPLGSDGAHYGSSDALSRYGCSREQPCHRRGGRYLLESSHQKNAGSTIAATNHVVGSLINPDISSLLTPQVLGAAWAHFGVPGSASRLLFGSSCQRRLVL